MKTIKRVVLSERRVCSTASSKRVLHVPPYVCVSISYSSHKPCGATAQRVRVGILEIFWGLISFVPQGLSGMGWLHTENVHAQHARDHNRFNSIPVKKKEHEKKRKERNIYIQFASMPKTLRTSLSAQSVCLHTCVRVCYK